MVLCRASQCPPRRPPPCCRHCHITLLPLPCVPIGGWQPVSLYACLYTHVYIHVYMYTHACTRVYTHGYTHVYTQISADIVYRHVHWLLYRHRRCCGTDIYQPRVWKWSADLRMDVFCGHACRHAHGVCGTDMCITYIGLYGSLY